MMFLSRRKSKNKLKKETGFLNLKLLISKVDLLSYYAKSLNLYRDVEELVKISKKKTKKLSKRMIGKHNKNQLNSNCQMKISKKLIKDALLKA